ncbi:MAG: hypothetical protein LUE17_15820 [Planctomycetaceae bacterium]|nr:hypothetical protein [Planctomycetaceae bacterium]
MNGSRITLRNIILNYGIYIAFVGICIVFAILNDRFLSARNFENILIQASIIAIAAIGQTLVIFTGGIDLSVGTLIGSTGILVGLAASNGLGIPGLICIGLLVGLTLGLINGFLIGYINIPPLYHHAGHPGGMPRHPPGSLAGPAVFDLSARV